MMIRSLLLSLLVGCASVQLDDKWQPLTKIQSNPAMPVGVYSTFGQVVLTHDLDDWFASSDDVRHGLLLHEQSHAIRERELGVGQFMYYYTTDPAFRWQEESAGWRLQIRDAISKGIGIDVVKLAHFLADNYAGMISFEAAINWINAVIVGLA